MIVRYSVHCTSYECIGIPDESGEYIAFVPEGVVCDVVRPGHQGVAVCTDRSDIRRYTLDHYKVYMYTGDEWVRVGKVNVWLTTEEVIYKWRPAIYVAKYKDIGDVSKRSREFLLESVVPREGCRVRGCVTDFYSVWRPKEGYTLLDLIDWAITVKRFGYFGVV